MFGALYNDAADEGIVLTNPKTGQSVPFYLSKVDRNEGDVFGWRFEVLPESVRKDKRLSGLKILIVNT